MTDSFAYEYEPMRAGQEVQLLQPWENNGEFYSLDLCQVDTIVVGPKALLTPFRDKGYQLYSYEDMSADQLDFFKVPGHLRPCFQEIEFVIPDKKIIQDRSENPINKERSKISNHNTLFKPQPNQISNTPKHQEYDFVAKNQTQG